MVFAVDCGSYVIHPLQLVWIIPWLLSFGLAGFFKNAKFKVNVGKVLSFNNLHNGYFWEFWTACVCFHIRLYFLAVMHQKHGIQLFTQLFTTEAICC
jgi:hypothetical protein